MSPSVTVWELGDTKKTLLMTEIMNEGRGWGWRKEGGGREERREGGAKGGREERREDKEDGEVCIIYIENRKNNQAALASIHPVPKCVELRQNSHANWRIAVLCAVAPVSKFRTTQV